MQGDTWVAEGTRRLRHWLSSAVAVIGLALGCVAGPATAGKDSNVPPTVSLSASPTTIAAGAFTSLTAVASDSDGTIRSVTFYNGETAIVTLNAAPYTTNFAASRAGTYSLTAVAKDDGGASATSAPITVTVGSGGGNVPPTVTLSSTSTSLTVAGAAATLTASAADSDGTIAKVEFYRGTTLMATDSVSPYNATFAPTTVGTFSITARAYDNLGAQTTSAAVSVTVGTSGPSNVPPTVTLSSTSSSLTVGGAVATLTATAADSDGTIAKVEFYNGATLMGTDSASPYNATFTPTTAGTFSITARAYDNLGAQSTSAAVSIAVGTSGSNNKVPTVRLTSSATSLTVGGVAATLTATAADRDGSITKVEFFNGTTLIATDTTSPYNATFSPTATGTFSITARAYDDRGAQTTSSGVNISVAAGTNKSPTVTLASSSTTLAVGGVAATLTATAADSDGTITRVEFYSGTTLIATDTTAPYNATFPPTAAGTFSVTARAYDNLGAQTTSAAVGIVVSSTNRSPTVSLASSTTTLPIGGIATLTATASDSDGTIAKVEFYNGMSLMRTVTTAPYTATLTGSAAGTYTITAKAYDNLGVATTSSPVSITVSSTTSNKPPTATLATSSTSFTLGYSATLTVTATDSDGTIAKVEFYNGATLMVTDTSSPYATTFIPAAVGTYSMTAKAYDNLGAITTSAPVTIVVSSAPLLPRVTFSLSNTLFAFDSTTPPTVTLTATAAATATGATVSRVSFFMNGTKLIDDTVSPYTATATLTRAQTYTFYAEVQDSLGQIVQTLPQQVVVQTAPAVATVDPDIWRLLNQATFGASQAEAANVLAFGTGRNAMSKWIDAQIAKPITGYPDSKYNRIQLAATPDCTTQLPNGTTAYLPDSPQAICARDHLTLAMVQRDFFTNAVNGADQLRQRVAWALSQIVVTSATERDLSYAYAMSRYQNILFNNAFGNYEQLLREVTYSPAMGNYLDNVNNDRPAGTRVPNENYAREIMQLFSINLVELNQDGTPILDAQGKPVPTYDQSDISEFARVFTGYTYANSTTQTSAPGKQSPYYAAPMVPYTTTPTTGHDPNVKTLLNGTVLPAGQTGQQDIDAAVRNVFMHPNTGVYVGKQLIQRLVTGNPSPAYVSRIAAVFNNNGGGVRGDLAAVVKAILLDSEARGTTKTASDFGQLREPVLAVTSLLRALSGLTDGARLAGAAGNLGQQPYYSPTVFNYFMPDAVVPGTSVLGPEFGIHTTVTAVGRANLIYTLVYGGYAPDTTIPNSMGTKLFLAPFEAIADQPATMVSLVNKYLAGGQFPASLEPTIVTAVQAVPATDRTARARMAVYLMASSYDYQVQR